MYSLGMVSIASCNSGHPLSRYEYIVGHVQPGHGLHCLLQLRPVRYSGIYSSGTCTLYSLGMESIASCSSGHPLSRYEYIVGPVQPGHGLHCLLQLGPVCYTRYKVGHVQAGHGLQCLLQLGPVRYTRYIVGHVQAGHGLQCLLQLGPVCYTRYIVVAHV